MQNEWFALIFFFYGLLPRHPQPLSSIICLHDSNREGLQHMPFHETLSGYCLTIQGQLSPWHEEELGPLSESHKKFVTVLELVWVGTFMRHWQKRPRLPA